MSFSEGEMNHFSEPIDAVITWVNGDDPLHKEKLNAYLKSIGHIPKAAISTRFRETGEFEFCITSLLQYAPWLRYIYIVTDSQTPDFMKVIRQSRFAERIQIIDHKVIFEGFDEFLPTFNSLSIETMLWRIPGLSNRFIYLNDDWVLLRPVSPEDFFRNGKLVVNGSWKIQHRKRIDRKLRLLISKIFNKNSNKSLSVHRNREGQSYAALMAGFQRNYFIAPHNPHPVLRDTLENYFSGDLKTMIRNINHKLRSPEQFVPESLAKHLAFKQNRVIVTNELITMLLKMNKISLLWLKLRLAIADNNSRIAFACIQSLDMAKPETREIIIKWLEKRVGRLSDIINK